MVIGTGAVVAAAAAPATASATTYCVARPACVSAGGTAKADVQAALGAASASGDRVEIGPGTFTGPASGFSVAPGSAPVTIVGSGSGAGGTILTRPGLVRGSGGSYTTGSVLDLLSRSADVSGVAIAMPAPTGAGSATTQLYGITASSTSRLHGVAVRTDAATATAAGASAIGVALRTSATLASSTVDVSSQLIAKAVLVSDGTVPSAPATVQDSSLTSSFSGIQLDDSTAAVRRTTISSPASTLDQYGGTLKVESSVLRGGGGARFEGDASSGAASATLDNTTIVSPTASSGSGLETYADGAAATLTLRSSVVSGFAQAVDRRSTGTDPSNVSLASNDLDTTEGVVPSGTMTGSTSSTGTLSVPPKFANAAGADYHPAAGSPLVDHGVTPAPSGLGPDRDGKARVVDGDGAGGARLDIGAYERAAPKPPTSPAPPTTTTTPTPPATTTTTPPTVPPATVPPATDPGFGRGAKVTLRSGAKRIRRSGRVRVVLVNANGFAVKARVKATTARPHHRPIRWTGVTSTVAASGRTTVSLRPPAAARRLLRARHRLTVRVTAVLTAPDGGTKTVRRTVRVRLRR